MTDQKLLYPAKFSISSKSTNVEKEHYLKLVKIPNPAAKRDFLLSAIPPLRPNLLE